MNKNEPELIEKAQHGDLAAYGELVKIYQTLVFKLTLSILGNHEDAEEAAQDVFIKAFLAIKNFRGDASFKTWISRIATRLCFNRVRDLKRKQKKLNIQHVDFNSLIKLTNKPLHNTNTSDAVESEEFQNWLLQTIHSLPLKYRQVLILNCLEDLRQEEISQILKIPIGTVRSRLYYARKRLMNLITKEYERTM